MKDERVHFQERQPFPGEHQDIFILPGTCADHRDPDQAKQCQKRDRKGHKVQQDHRFQPRHPVHRSRDQRVADGNEGP